MRLPISGLKRRLAERRERRWRERLALTERLTSLINQARDQFDERLYESVLEYAGQTEWELAVDVIRTEMRDGRLVLKRRRSGRARGHRAKPAPRALVPSPRVTSQLMRRSVSRGGSVRRKGVIILALALLSGSPPVARRRSTDDQ